MKRRDFLKSLTATGLLVSSDLGLASAAKGAEPATESLPGHLLVAYTWSTGDLGGIGIVPGLLNLVRKADPGLPTTVFSMQSRGPDHEFLKGYLPRFLPDCRVLPNPFSSALVPARSESAWHAFQGRWGETKLREFENGSLAADTAKRIAADLLDEFPLELYRQLQREDPEAARAFAGAGFFLYPSGTTLNFGRAGLRGLWTKGQGTDLRLSLPLLVARALKIPYGIAGQSFDAVEWPVDLVYRPLLKEASFVYCRDTDSLEYLRQRDLLNARSGFRPDSTFFFNGSDEPWADAFLAARGLKDRGFMAVIGRFAETRGPISGVLTPEREQQHLEKYRRLIEGWIAKTDLPVVICPEAKSEPPLIRQKLHSLLSPSARQRSICMDSFWTPEQACSLYRRARLVVGHMHTIIYALSVGTPVLHIPYAEAGRKARMVEDVGLGDWLLDIDETLADELLEAALRIHRGNDEARQRVQKALAQVERLGLEMMAEVKLGWRTTGWRGT